MFETVVIAPILLKGKSKNKKLKLRGANFPTQSHTGHE